MIRSETPPKDGVAEGDVLVVGASGYVGGRLVPALLRKGRRVRALVRDPRKLATKVWRNEVEVFRGDVSAPETLAPALEGTDVAYYLVHSLGAAGGAFAERDVEAAKGFAAAAKAAGVRRIVYLGGLGAEEADLSAHLRSRQDTGVALRSGGVPVVELRAAIIVGSGSASFEIIRDLVRRLPIMICPRWVGSLCEPIAIRDVIAYLVGVLDLPESTDDVFEIGGGEVMSYADLLRGAAKAIGRRLRILVVPVLTPRLSSYWLNLVTSVPFSVARPLVEGLRNDVIVRDRRLADLVAVEPTPYREAVERALGEGAGGARLDSRWTSAEPSVSRRTFAGATLRDVREVPCAAGPEFLFDRVRRVGGATGWYFADAIWRVRGAVDRLFGGPGMRRGREHESEIAVGDAIDFWRVDEIDDGRLLRLRAEMRIPGAATLTFEARPNGPGSILVQTAEFVPDGVWGRAYWYLLVPIHAIVFRTMAKRIVAAAENAARGASRS